MRKSTHIFLNHKIVVQFLCDFLRLRYYLCGIWGSVLNKFCNFALCNNVCNEYQEPNHHNARRADPQFVR